MEKIYFYFLFFILFISPINSISEDWRNYLSCGVGRLQSPIELNEYESDYSNSFSFVYEYYNTGAQANLNNTYTKFWTITNGGYVNFEKQGVIKQYELQKIELYNGIHKIDGKLGDYELHLVHKKNLDFNSHKNQYRKIVDANMYLTVVLRYKKNCIDTDIKCISDNGLLSTLIPTSPNSINLNNYPIYQDKRAYFYEGSFLYTPCDENVNYYVVDDFFYSDVSETDFNNTINDIAGFDEIIRPKNKYGRPVLKNFMNYREFLKSKNISINMYYLILMICLIFI